MRLSDLFNDENHINEKSVIGIISFLIMIVYSLVDVIYAMMSKAVEINERIYTAFETIVLGAFLISSGEKIVKVITHGKNNRLKKNNIREEKKGEGTEKEGAEG